MDLKNAGGGKQRKKEIYRKYKELGQQLSDSPHSRSMKCN
jgi:hypothetical protein